MKCFIISFLLCITFTIELRSQSQVFEIQPEFYWENGFQESEESTLFSERRPIDFIRLSCYHFEEKDVVISFRIKRANKWSKWQEFVEEQEFVNPNRSAYSTNLIQQSFSAIQFRIDRVLASPPVFRMFIASPSMPTLKSSSQIRSESCELPVTCLRECWCPTCPIDNTPQLTEPTHLIVHHSAGTNVANNWEMIVESIWDLHVNTNGWDDIGYNWLIDPNGVVYEGRPDDYQGAHFSCLNENTVGICVLGNFTNVRPAEPALESLINLLAYEATAHDIDIEDEAYHVKGDYFLTTIAGHRDSQGSANACSSTLCPGDQFYPLLDSIRTEVADLACYREFSSSLTEISKAEYNVYPNPAHDLLFVETNSPFARIIRIIDSTGKVVGSGKINASINVGNFPPGLYYLLSEGKVAGKFVKL